MRFLITGAAGFIGSNLARQLANSNHEVVGVDNLSDYYSPELKHLRVNHFLLENQIDFVKLDLCEGAEVARLVKSVKPDVIVHLAAHPGIRTPLKASNLYIQNNIVAYSNILEAAVEHEISDFLYASSSSVYGNSRNFPFSEDDRSITPVSVYGATKLANEFLASAYVAGSKTRARGMRFFTVYGPWGRPDMAYLRIINCGLTGNQFIKFGSGEVKRDFTYVDDISEQIEKLVIQMKGGLPGSSDVVNIGGGAPHSLNDLILMIGSQLNKKIDIIESNFNPSDTLSTLANLATLRALTGNVPEVELSLGIKKTIDWAGQSAIKVKLSEWVNSVR